ncbi:hypothetical protein HEO65_013395, partial [Escherichia coli]|nr:hypothetical protein [Escherichia coli]MBB8189548.1 hypothetical protein [Escherichia coli]
SHRALSEHKTLSVSWSHYPKEQLDYLNQNNITFQQGYYFYKPVTYIDLVKIILSKPKVKVVVE